MRVDILLRLRHAGRIRLCRVHSAALEINLWATADVSNAVLAREKADLKQAADQCSMATSAPSARASATIVCVNGRSLKCGDEARLRRIRWPLR